MSSLDIFISFFEEYYSHEFLDLPQDFKMHWIKEIIINNGAYLKKEDVLNFDGCIRCGRCCQSQHCLDWDPETKLCTRHDNPIDDLCIEYPWTGELGIAPLTLNCRYQVSYFISFFDDFFEKEVENA